MCQSWTDDWRKESLSNEAPITLVMSVHTYSKEGTPWMFNGNFDRHLFDLEYDLVKTEWIHI